MATVTAGVSAADTTNNAALTTGSFTPAADDLLIAFGAVTGQVGGGTFTDSQGLGWTPVTLAIKNGSIDSLRCAVADNFAANIAMTVTFTPDGSPTSTGVAISVLRVAGMSRKGSAAIRQSAKQDNQAAGTPAPSFAVAALTGNPTVGAVQSASNPTVLTPPTDWTEAHDTGHDSPTHGLESVFRNSGFTGQTITWGTGSASAFDSTIVELDTTAALTDQPYDLAHTPQHQALMAM